MTIAELRGKCKSALERIPKDVLLVAVLCFSSVLSFIFGYFAGQDIRQGSANTSIPAPAAALEAKTAGLPAGQAGKYVASKSGTRFYLPSCTGAERISESNKIWFDSSEEARAAGYTPALNCKGL